MKILISNDDGMESPGIHTLAASLQKLGEVTVVAPHRERSTAGHSLTLHKPLRIVSVGDNKYATSGTPADCIYLGMREVMKSLPGIAGKPRKLAALANFSWQVARCLSQPAVTVNVCPAASGARAADGRLLFESLIEAYAHA